MEFINHIILILFIIVSFGARCNTVNSAGITNTKHPVENQPKDQLVKDQISFTEIWGYLMKGEESELKGNEEFTHIFYFSASLNPKGRIKEKIKRPDITLKNGFKPAVHLVVAEVSNSSLLHFALNPEYNIRYQLIEDICKAAGEFDGVQIDFESLLPDDAKNYLSFISALKKRISPKMISVAVPARTRDTKDAYSYKNISSIVDRIVIMAYDEHWSNSSPGPVASLPWCSDVVNYASGVVDNKKIIMGLPFYGRAWQDKKHAKAYRYSQINEITESKKINPDYKPENGPNFQYSETINVNVFYDDIRSLQDKLSVYKKNNIRSVSFWRIGQGPDNLWNLVVRQN